MKEKEQQQNKKTNDNKIINDQYSNDTDFGYYSLCSEEIMK